MLYLRDGGLAHIRPVRENDTGSLAALLTRLGTDGADDRMRRLLGDRPAEALTEVDYEQTMTFVVEVGGTVVGVGRYDIAADAPGTAEVAVAIEDAHQGRGIGTQLLMHLSAYAAGMGITAFRAFVLPDNYAMMRVFRNSGFRHDPGSRRRRLHGRVPGRD
jgi:RimJ/RimL family protein N-acetyltransferase